MAEKDKNKMSSQQIYYWRVLKLKWVLLIYIIRMIEFENIL